MSLKHPLFEISFCEFLRYRNGTTEVKSTDWKVDGSLSFKRRVDLREDEFKEEIIIILTVGQNLVPCLESDLAANGFVCTVGP